MKGLKRWRGPTIKEIAQAAKVAPATVDRVLNHRPLVKERTRKRVLDAIEVLKLEQNVAVDRLDLALLCESGRSFNRQMQNAMIEVSRREAHVEMTGQFLNAEDVDPRDLARKILEHGTTNDGLLLTARDHPAVNRAVRQIERGGVPVICVTTDLPSARRTAYIGNNQYHAGSVAAQLIGQGLTAHSNRILIVTSQSYACQQEREIGFRRVLRSEFSHLKIEERVTTNDSPDHSYEQVKSYFNHSGIPDAIYNVAGGNRGIGQALEEFGAQKSCRFVGHELSESARQLLESGVMDYVISHNFRLELTFAVEAIRQMRSGLVPKGQFSNILVHTKYNCDLVTD